MIEVAIVLATIAFLILINGMFVAAEFSLVMAPRAVVAPEECSRGTRPSQAVS